MPSSSLRALSNEGVATLVESMPDGVSEIVAMGEGLAGSGELRRRKTVKIA
jgi:hypothetical protein